MSSTREPAEAEFVGELLPVERRGQLADAVGGAGLGERGGLDAELGEQLAGRFVVFGVNPGRIERVVAFFDLEEAGRLDERRFAEAADVHQLLAALERAVLLAMLVDAAGRELIHAGNVAQQGPARAVHVDADEAHAELHDVVERVAEVLRAGVVLIQTDADAGRVDFHQLAERILQAAADRDRAALERVALREFLAADFAGRIDARARFVHDDVVDVFAGELGARGCRRAVVRSAGRRCRCRWRSR